MPINQLQKGFYCRRRTAAAVTAAAGTAAAVTAATDCSNSDVVVDGIDAAGNNSRFAFAGFSPTSATIAVSLWPRFIDFACLRMPSSQR